MSELRELYQEVILDHNRKPRNFRTLPSPTQTAEGYNPLCGDRVSVELALEGDVIRDIAFHGSGCAISRASASMMTSSLKGKTLGEAEEAFDHFHGMLTDDRPSGEPPAALGKLAAFEGVREFPIRIKCATLPWHTLRAAMAGEAEPVSTE
ncbi:MAG: SUF system NifU family Fe-S cluster assembly protein [Candidatus Rokubacteria bacterium]|nr:SUF system NifU family Fe-S cluster assembly protein [Candidatus Rokubacteria bacterium]